MALSCTCAISEVGGWIFWSASFNKSITVSNVLRTITSAMSVISPLKMPVTIGVRRLTNQSIIPFPVNLHEIFLFVIKI